MAKAKRIPPPEPSYEIELTLSKEEAETLYVIIQKIAGCPISSPRKHTDAIGKALSSAGVKHINLKVNTLNYIDFSSY